MPKLSGMVLNSPQLTITIKLITANFEYALKSADQPKPTAVFYIIDSTEVRYAKL